MTRIDFYVLQKDTKAAQAEYACRIVEKALKQKCEINIATASSEHSKELDEKLWTSLPESFIPHLNLDLENGSTDKAMTNKVSASENVFKNSVNISSKNIDCEHYDVLINLSTQVPPKFSRYNRLIEVVVQDSDILESTRQQHQFYKERGYPIFVHKLG